MALGFMTFSVVDVSAKFLTLHLHPLQIVWVRQSGFLVYVLVYLAIYGFAVLKSARPGLQALRGSIAVVSATAFITAVAFIPIADAVAISFVAPFFVTILGAFWLKERVGIRRWTAVCVGFLGALIIIRPGLGVLHPASGLVIVAALFFSLRQILSRILGGVDSTQTTIAYSALVGSALITIPLPFVWTWPGEAKIWLLLGFIAVLAVVAEFLVIRALELAEAVAVAPVHYTMMLWGTLWGYVVFSDLPDLWTWVGALIIITSGAYSLYRERLSTP